MHHLRLAGRPLHVISMHLAENDPTTTCDTLLGGSLTLRQPAKGHRAGTDALLLAALVRGLSGADVADFGAGAGTAGLALAVADSTRRLVLVEMDPAQAALASGNTARNGLEARVRVVTGDVTVPEAMEKAGLPRHSQDVVMMNPPFLDSAQGRHSPLAQRRAAHAMPAGALALWLKAARRCLRPSGHVALIHRADAVAEILAALATGFGAVTLRPVHPRAGEPAHRLLVTARLSRKTPAVILPGLVLHAGPKEDGLRFTEGAEAIHRHLAPITSC
jgi:tRNA1(Val) A37 N6-methylase TrmN6